jgi:hypothetical protein
MKRLAAILAAALAAVTLMFAPPAQATIYIPTHTVLGVPFRDHGCQVILTASGQRWSRSRHTWVASFGQYVQLQIWRNGGWRYLTAVNVQRTNNAAWAVQSVYVHECAKHKYRAVMPPAWVTTFTYQLGSHSSAKSG